MNTRLSHMISARGLYIAIAVIMALAISMPSASQEKTPGTEPAPVLEPAAKDATPSPVSTDAAVSEAEQHFRNGVDLYNRNLYLEALGEFNRALALDPQMEKAKTFRDKSSAKLQISAAGGNAAEQPIFDTVSPEAIPAGAETSQLSAEEMKIKRVAELLKQGEIFLENQRYRKAVKVYEEVMLIAPDNTRAREGLHKATVGANEDGVKDTDKKIDEDRLLIEKYTREAKTLPKNSDATGIKPYRIQLPIAQEEFVAPKEKSEIEKTLDAPVSIEFENIHLADILEFISDSYDVNIVPDDRVIMKPPKAAPAPAAVAPGAPGMPGMPGMPGQFQPPGGAMGRPPAPTMAPIGGNNALRRPNTPGAFGVQGGGYGNQQQANANFGGEGYATDGMINYINLKNVTLREALKALLRPLNLDYAVQPGFIWISTPEKIRLESFEELETRYYELRNAGAETLFKIVLRNPGGSGGGGMMGGMGGGMGGYGGGRGGMMGGGMGGMSGGYGGMSGGMGGYGGGGMGGMGGGGMGGYGGGMGGMGGGYGGGMGGMSGGYGGGGMGGYGGGMGGMGGGMMGGGRMGGMGGGMMGGGGSMQIQNISQLFGSISDTMVGETPAIIGTAGLSAGGTGNVGTARGGGYGGGAGGAQGAAGLGGAAGRAQNFSGDEPEVVRLLRMLIDDVYEPNSAEPVSRMIYIPHNNQLIVHNTPTNLGKLEKQLAQLDITPKQVSIEAKFLTVKTSDLNKVGFKWDMTQSDQGNRAKKLSGLDTTTYNYDVNGDGVTEAVPFYSRPNGSNVIRNTISNAVMAATASPGPVGAFSLSGIITDNADGDKLGVVFDYLNELEESELLSAPRVTTMNRKPAVIADLSTEYFVSAVDTQIATTEGTLGGSGQLGYSQSITPQPFNFGITLSVTPQISGGDQVRLWLNPQVTTRGLEKKFTQRSVINGTEITDEITLPNTTTQAVWTNVIVHDGDTLVLGGLVSDQTVKGRRKMPYLADIPVLGFFFKGKSKQVTQSSLLIFVTPTIIDTTGARFFEASSGPAPMRKAVTPTATVGPDKPAANASFTEDSPITITPTEATTGAASETSAEPVASGPEKPAKAKELKGGAISDRKAKKAKEAEAEEPPAGS